MDCINNKAENHYQPENDNDEIISQLQKIEELTPSLALKKMGGRTKLYISLVKSFHMGQEQTIADLDAEHELIDYDLLYRTTHTLKSNAAYIGAFELVKLCNTCELSLKNKVYSSSMLADIVLSLTTLLQQLGLIFNQESKEENNRSFPQSCIQINANDNVA